METKLKIDKRTKRYKMNDDVTYEKLNEQGYFVVPTTEKIIVMNETSYFLWKTIMEFANAKAILSIDEIEKRFREQFECSDITAKSLRDDILHAIFHFENEDFMREVQ